MNNSASPERCLLCGNRRWHTVVTTTTSAGHDTASPVYACTSRTHGEHVRVMECMACALRVLADAPPPAEVEAAYAAVEDLAYLTIEPQRSIAYEKLAKRLTQWVRPPGKLLDVGCYTGLFPEIAQKEGWDAYGLEPSRWAAARAAERLPGRITNGFLCDAPFPPESFDVITAWDVIEHVTDPVGDLQQMARLLKPDGWLFLSTMRSDAPIVKLLGARWPWYMEMHRFYFTPRTLEALLEKSGFSLRAVAPYPHYTNVHYLAWKLEGLVPPIGKLVRVVSNRLHLSDRTLKIDLGDFFLAVAQRSRTPFG